MTKYDLKPIIKTFYDALEEGTILGRKCQRCGHVEFPPFLLGARKQTSQFSSSHIASASSSLLALVLTSGPR